MRALRSCGLGDRAKLIFDTATEGGSLIIVYIWNAVLLLLLYCLSMIVKNIMREYCNREIRFISHESSVYHAPFRPKILLSQLHTFSLTYLLIYFLVSRYLLRDTQQQFTTLFLNPIRILGAQHLNFRASRGKSLLYRPRMARPNCPCAHGAAPLS